MSAINKLTHEARELVDAYERCKWLEQFQPQGDLTSYELEHLETLSNDVHYAFWNNKRRIALIEQMTNQLAAVTKERDELRRLLNELVAASRSYRGSLVVSKQFTGNPQAVTLWAAEDAAFSALQQGDNA